MFHTNNSGFRLRNRSILFLLFIMFASNFSFSQSDTLHLYYLGLQTKMADTTDAKVTKWAKQLKGKHVDVDVLCYYSESDFKKYAVERSEDLFLVLNRKARDLITIKSNKAVKGKKSQRSLVDVVYRFTDGSAPVSEPKKEEVKKEESAGTNTGNSSSEQKKTEEKKEDVSSSTSTNSPPPPVITDGKNTYIMDSVYVNGVLKVTKRKVKKK